jgi:hypothetical protein
MGSVFLTTRNWVLLLGKIKLQYRKTRSHPEVRRGQRRGICARIHEGLAGVVEVALHQVVVYVHIQPATIITSEFDSIRQNFELDKKKGGGFDWRGTHILSAPQLLRAMGF